MLSTSTLSGGSFPTSTASSSSNGGLSTVAMRRASGNIQMPWFHGNITRDKTEKLLRGKSDGTFLIRESTNFPGDFTLCMAFNGKVEHYRVYQVNDQLTCDHEETFDNLTQLVSHYKRDADGLCHRLVTPMISESFRLSCEAANFEERQLEFRRAGLLLQRSELQTGDVIGHGEFGDVLIGSYKQRQVAVKVLKNGMTSDLLNEARFMIHLRHQHLVALVGVVLDASRDVYMLTEYMANGNLVDYLRSRGRHQVEKDQLILFALNVADGMAYMESCQLVHRDLAARNILLDENFGAKVSDFGLAQPANATEVDVVRGKFPIKWTAPEALRHSIFTNKSDVWSFGILLWEIFSFGRVPYPRIPIQDVVRHIEKGYRMESPEGCPPEIVTVMSETWALEAVTRPTFAQLVNRLRNILNLYT